MSIGLGQPDSVTAPWAHEWRRLIWAAFNQATGHCLQGCANVAMARSPLLAIEAMQQTQKRLCTHSAYVFAEAITLWRRQNSDLLVRTKHQHTPDRKRSDVRLREQKPTDEEVR